MPPNLEPALGDDGLGAPGGLAEGRRDRSCNPVGNTGTKDRFSNACLPLPSTARQRPSVGQDTDNGAAETSSMGTGADRRPPGATNARPGRSRAAKNPVLVHETPVRAVL